MTQDSNTPHLSDEQAKSYVRKIVVAAVLVFAVLIAGVFYLVNIIKGDPVAPLAPPAANTNIAATAHTAAPDGLALANPRSAYDLPVTERDKDPELRLITGRVTAVVPRHDIMSNGSARQNLYARTEFTVPTLTMRSRYCRISRGERGNSFSARKNERVKSSNRKRSSLLSDSSTRMRPVANSSRPGRRLSFA